MPFSYTIYTYMVFTWIRARRKIKRFNLFAIFSAKVTIHNR